MVLLPRYFLEGQINCREKICTWFLYYHSFTLYDTTNAAISLGVRVCIYHPSLAAIFITV